jgi:hypothetical protein
MRRRRLALYGILVTGLLSGLGLIANAHNNPDPIGLSLLFQNSAMAPLTLAGDAPRYLQEIDVVATVPTPDDRGIQPLMTSGELASLDWTGVEMVEEDWRPAGNGTFIRQRFYRKARWMERSSFFRVVPTDDAGRPAGQPLMAHAGKDDRLGSQDDAFVRRFVARQSAFGCPAQGDCTGASFVAQGLVQLRDALSATQNARTIPPRATRLSLWWSEQPAVRRTVQIAHAAPADFPVGYGFQPALDVINPPANQQYYVPGETVRFRVTFRDGAGRRLHPRAPCPPTDSSCAAKRRTACAITTVSPCSPRSTMP